MFFGFSIYFAFNEREGSLIERFFFDLKKKISIYKHHLSLTEELYQKELVLSKSKLAEEFERNKKAGEERYQKALKKLEGSEYAEDYADNQSGLREIYHYYELDVQANQERFHDVHSIFNKSALIGLYSLFEAESLKLSGFLKELFNKRIGYEHLKSENYLKGYLNYYDFVLELDVSNLSKFENKLNDLRILRNQIVHENGDFTNSKNKLESLVKSSNGTARVVIQGSNYLLEITSIKFLEVYFEAVEQYFEQLFWEIDKNLGWPLLKEKLEYLFKFIDPELKVENIDVDITSEKRNVKVLFSNTNTEPPLGIKVDLLLKKSSVDKIKVTNERKENPLAVAFANNLYLINDVLRVQIFNGFHFSRKGLCLEMKIY